MGNYEKEERSVTMTNGQWAMLQCYLLMTTHYREDEIRTWTDLAQEKKEDGTPRYKNAESNARFWIDLSSEINQALKKIDA